MGLESLACQFTAQLDADALISALPRLQELRVMASGGTEFKAVAKLLTAKRLGQLRLAAVGSYHFVSPFTPEGRLELRSWSRSDYEIHAQSMPLLPEGCVSKVIIRPRDSDAWSSAGPPPSEAAQQAIRAASRVPVELAWY